MMLRSSSIAILAAMGIVVLTPVVEAQQDEQEQVQQLREQVQALQVRIEQLEDALDAYHHVLVLEDPELAGLAAIDASRVLGGEQRMEFLSAVLRDDNTPPLVRNAAFLEMIDLVGEEGNVPEETAELLQRMVRENAQRWQAEQPWVRERLRGHLGRPPRGFDIYRRPPGRLLERDPYARQFYRYWHPDDLRRRTPLRFRQPRELYDVPDFPYSHPLWRR